MLKKAHYLQAACYALMETGKSSSVEVTSGGRQPDKHWGYSAVLSSSSFNLYLVKSIYLDRIVMLISLSGMQCECG